MKNNVIFVHYKILESFEYEKYGGNILDQYFNLEIWDLHEIFLGSEIAYPKEIYMGKNVKNFKSIVLFTKALNQYNRKRTFIFFLIPPHVRKTYYLQAIVSLMGFKYSMAFCQPYLSSCNIGKLQDDFNKMQKDLGNAFINLLFPPKYNFIATAANYREFPSISSIKNQNNILIHTLDYDVFLNIKDEKKRIIEEKYIVFIDECYVSHVDYQIFGVDSPFKKSEDYYNPMRKLFDFVETRYGYRVIIAEHPRSDYRDRNVFGNREMIKGQTARLIRDAEFVLCHTSTALDYIILFKKNYILIYLDEIKRFYEWNCYYVPLIKYLKLNALNISKEYDENKFEEAVSSGKSKECLRYKQSFIKQHGTEEKLFFEIVVEKIREYFKEKKVM